MRSSNSNLVHGTTGSPQFTSEQLEYEREVAENERRVLHELMVDNDLMEELESSGARFTRKDIEFVARDQTGQIVWLEKGNANAGLEHILHGDGERPGHAIDFMRALKIKEKDISEYLYKVVTLGAIVKNEIKPVNGNRVGYERVYRYEGQYYVVAGIGTNGFIVSAYPSDKYKE